MYSWMDIIYIYSSSLAGRLSPQLESVLVERPENMLYQSHTGNVARNSVLSGPVVERNVDALQAQIMAGEYVTLQEEAQEGVGPISFERVIAFMFAGLLLGAMWWLVSEPKPDALPHAAFLGFAAPSGNLPCAALYTKADDKCANLPNVYIGNEDGWCSIFTGIDADVPGFRETDGKTAESLAPGKNTTCPGEESACVAVNSKASKKKCCQSFFNGLKANLESNDKEKENENGDGTGYGDGGKGGGEGGTIPCETCVAFPANCPTTRYVQCLAHGAGGGNYGTWIANLAFKCAWNVRVPGCVGLSSGHVLKRMRAHQLGKAGSRIPRDAQVGYSKRII